MKFLVCVLPGENTFLTVQSLCHIRCEKDLIAIACPENENLGQEVPKETEILNYSCGKNTIESLNSLIKQFQRDYITFVPRGAVLARNFFQRLCEDITKNSDGAAFLARTEPRETARHVDPVTLSMARADIDFLTIKKEDFILAGGLCEEISIYGAGEELALRLRRRGKRIYYCPKAVALLVQKNTDEKDKYCRTLSDNAVMAARFFGKVGEKKAKEHFASRIKNPEHFSGVRRELLRRAAGLSSLLSISVKFYREHGDLARKAGNLWENLPYERGTFTKPLIFENQDFDSEDLKAAGIKTADSQPLVSVVVRTRNRPGVLRKTLSCLENQTYENFEVIVSEDGSYSAKDIASLFPNLNLRYISTGEKAGRGKTANTGFENAKGEFICILDDDDFYYPDYIYTYVSDILSSGTDISVGGVAARGREPDCEAGDVTFSFYTPVIFDRINLMDMCVKCRIPSCGGIFRRELFKKYKGMREDIDGDEDWHMWLKFVGWGKRSSQSRPDVQRAMAMVSEEPDPLKAEERQEAYSKYDREMIYDPALSFAVPGSTSALWETRVLGDMLHLKNLGLDLGTAIGKPLGKEKLEYDRNKDNILTAGQINSYYYFLAEKYFYGEENS